MTKLFFSKRGILVFSEELLDEFLEVCKRPKFNRFFSKSDIEKVLETIDEYADFVIVETQTTVCRDAKDNFLLSLTADGNVDFLLTGDGDLLELKKFNGTNIITIADFLKLYNP